MSEHRTREGWRKVVATAAPDKEKELLMLLGVPADTVPVVLAYVDGARVFRGGQEMSSYKFTEKASTYEVRAGDDQKVRRLLELMQAGTSLMTKDEKKDLERQIRSIVES